MMPGQSGSFSSCPLGYGPDARRSRRSVEHLQRLQEGLLRLEERTGVRLTLALEPEPDGAFERVADLGDWLLKEVLGDLEPDQRRIGICWDLCHSAVVGETPEEALACFEAGVPCGKIQVSSALECDAELGPEDLAVLEGLSRDPYLHQVRGRLRDGRPYACSDLARLLAHPSDLGELASLRIHCHVPVHRETYGGALGATRWRDAVAAALAAGHREFELETYTLPVLPPAFLEGSSTVATLVAETRASGAALGLADPSPAS